MIPVQEFRFDVADYLYGADACVVWCFDDRFDPAQGPSVLRAWMAHRGWRHADVIKWPGGARALADEHDESRHLVEKIAVSLRLHRPPRIVLMMHEDCGACGGRAAFPDQAAEHRHHVEVLRAAGRRVQGHFPSTAVELKLATFQGIWDVPLDAARTEPGR